MAALQQRNNTAEGNPAVGCVRLRGSVHTEERVAFREIARQLCREFGLAFLRSASFWDNLKFMQKIMKDLSRYGVRWMRSNGALSFDVTLSWPSPSQKNCGAATCRSTAGP